MIFNMTYSHRILIIIIKINNKNVNIILGLYYKLSRLINYIIWNYPILLKRLGTALHVIVFILFFQYAIFKSE